jgi:hypothetical protein
MSTLSIDKGWLSGPAGSYVLLNSIRALRVARSQIAADGFDVDALVEGQWISIAAFPDERSAHDRIASLLKELKHLFKYGS